MIDVDLARALRAAGLAWRPLSGDTFTIDRTDVQGEVFTVSDMTIEPHEFDTGTILGFNGTTEWALDSLALEDALWLPREDQLRERLGEAFVALERHGERYAVRLSIAGAAISVEERDPAVAYGRALLAVLEHPDAAAR